VTRVAIGYVHGSTGGLYRERAVAELKEDGCADVIVSHVPRWKQDHSRLAEAIALVPRRGFLIVHSIGDLGESPSELRKVIRSLMDKRVRLRALAEMIDTTERGGRLVLRLILGDDGKERKALYGRPKRVR
jgi:DNA invertase Pin-like site-specific DNA recombinase